MVWLSNAPKIELISICLRISIATISFICGVLTLWLIYSMKLKNEFILLVIHLTTSQMIFDLTAYLKFCDPSNFNCANAEVFIAIYMAILIVLWTNLIITNIIEPFP